MKSVINLKKLKIRLVSILLICTIVCTCFCSYSFAMQAGGGWTLNIAQGFYTVDEVLDSFANQECASILRNFIYLHSDKPYLFIFTREGKPDIYTSAQYHYYAIVSDYPIFVGHSGNLYNVCTLNVATNQTTIGVYTDSYRRDTDYSSLYTSPFPQYDYETGEAVGFLYSINNSYGHFTMNVTQNDIDRLYSNVWNDADGYPVDNASNLDWGKPPHSEYNILTVEKVSSDNGDYLLFGLNFYYSQSDIVKVYALSLADNSEVYIPLDQLMNFSNSINDNVGYCFFSVYCDVIGDLSKPLALTHFRVIVSDEDNLTNPFEQIQGITIRTIQDTIVEYEPSQVLNQYYTDVYMEQSVDSSVVWNEFTLTTRRPVGEVGEIEHPFYTDYSGMIFSVAYVPDYVHLTYSHVNSFEHYDIAVFGCDEHTIDNMYGDGTYSVLRSLWDDIANLDDFFYHWIYLHLDAIGSTSEGFSTTEWSDDSVYICYNPSYFSKRTIHALGETGTILTTIDMHLIEHSDLVKNGFINMGIYLKDNNSILSNILNRVSYIPDKIDSILSKLDSILDNLELPSFQNTYFGKIVDIFTIFYDDSKNFINDNFIPLKDTLQNPLLDDGGYYDGVDLLPLPTSSLLPSLTP